MKRLAGKCLTAIMVVVIVGDGTLYARTAFAAPDVTITRIADKGGQRRWEVVGMNGAADKGKCFEYDETNDFGGDPPRVVTEKKTSLPLEKNGKLVLWTAQNTTLGAAGTFVICPNPGAPVPGAPAPGGNEQLNFIPGPGGSYPTLSFGLVILDSDAFASGPHGSDPLLGASVLVSSLHVYVGFEGDSTISFGANFTDSLVPQLRIIKNSSVVFSADVLDFYNGPGESEFRAQLANVHITNTIGSSILSQLSGEILQGHLLRLRFIPGSGQNMATATRDVSAFMDYAVAGSVTGRVGIESTMATELPASGRLGLGMIMLLLSVLGTAVLRGQRQAERTM